VEFPLDPPLAKMLLVSAHLGAGVIMQFVVMQ